MISKIDLTEILQETDRLRNSYFKKPYLPEHDHFVYVLAVTGNLIDDFLSGENVPFHLLADKIRKNLDKLNKEEIELIPTDLFLKLYCLEDI